jgi:hypothetical protein
MRMSLSAGSERRGQAESTTTIVSSRVPERADRRLTRGMPTVRLLLHVIDPGHQSGYGTDAEPLFFIARPVSAEQPCRQHRNRQVSRPGIPTGCCGRARGYIQGPRATPLFESWPGAAFGI